MKTSPAIRSAAQAPSGNTLQTADENRRMFDRVSPRYDRLNAILSLGLDRRWRRLAVAALGPGPRQRFLDVGCGTGDLCLELLRVSPASLVVGLDPSPRMLERAWSKVRTAGLADRVELRPGDVMALEFGGASFDGILSAFCIRNVTDRLGGLREMRRVLKPGGRVVILELTRPRSRLVRGAHRLYSRCVVPFIAGLVSDAGAYRYLADSIAGFPAPQTIVALMQDAGFARVSQRPLSGGIVTLFAGEA